MPYKVFISHGADDTWLAAQMGHCIEEAGCTTFLDVRDIAKGADFKAVVKGELSQSAELVALFTPWSAKRSWVWIELGAAWVQGQPVVAVFHGMWISDLRAGEQGAAILEDINAVRLNDFDAYLEQLKARGTAGGIA
ncbi:MAG: toll/interleukin-1 receptor domain-containing protein [Gemmatimonadaceae bacterium]